MATRTIITAASAAYGPSLLALLGSLNLNWPGHPPVKIYDLGLDPETIAVLSDHNLTVHPVPAFCPHWRKHFTWKIWCLNDVTEEDTVLWMDAGFVVMEPLEEIFSLIEKLDYFAVPNYQLLDWEASPMACEGCGLDPNFRKGKRTFAGGLIGFKRTPQNIDLLQEALSVALHEPYIQATEATHRHDQAILSLLLYKYHTAPLFSDGLVYLGWKSPRQVPGQKIWAHRRQLRAEDQAHLQRHITGTGAPFIPQNPLKNVGYGSPLRKILRMARQRLPLKRQSVPEQPAPPYDGVKTE